MDLAIREFNAKLINEINTTQLPIEVKRLIIKDIYNQLDKAANEIVAQSIAKRNNANNDAIVGTEETAE